MGQALWSPTQQDIAASHLDRFRREAGCRDYAQLQRWSVERREPFWRALWQFAGVIGDPGGEPCEDIDRLPGTRWFPHARLSFAENLLARRDPGVALNARDESGTRSSLTFAELATQVGEVASFLARAGVRPGSRVAAMLPNRIKIIELIEKGEITEDTNPKQAAVIIQKTAGWTGEEAERLWAIEAHRNILINAVADAQCPKEAQDSIISGFKWACKNGPLCEEPMRGIKVKILDAQLNEDPTHRGPAQLVPATRRGILGSFLTAKPTLVEPIFKISVTAPEQWVGQVSTLITRQKGTITASEPKGPITSIEGYIPVRQTFGLTAEMRSATSGHAFWQSTVDHWERIPENIAHPLIREIRVRRGLRPEIPTADEFIDEM